MDVREELAGKKADITHTSDVLAAQTKELKAVQSKLEETAVMLHQADVQVASLTAELGSVRRELSHEQRDLADTQTQLAAVQEQLEKAKHWNDIQVCLLGLFTTRPYTAWSHCMRSNQIALLAVDVHTASHIQRPLHGSNGTATDGQLCR